jgi:hypothetical protein
VTFDPRTWLARYEQVGGGYAITPGGKLVFMTGAVDGLSVALAMRQVVGHPTRLSAVRATLAERVLA